VTDIPKGGTSYLLGTGFLPLHPVTFFAFSFPVSPLVIVDPSSLL